jgi:hypothetical protein
MLDPSDLQALSGTNMLLSPLLTVAGVLDHGLLGVWQHVCLLECVIELQLPPHPHSPVEVAPAAQQKDAR